VLRIESSCAAKVMPIPVRAEITFAPR